MISRRYIDRRGKQLWPTELGMDLIGKLPEASLASAELTGQWEARLNRMARGEDSAADFMTSIVTYVEQLVGKVRGTPPPAALTSSAARSPAEPRQRTQRFTSAPAKRPKAAPAKRSKAAPAKRPESNHPAPGTVVEPALVCPRCKSAPLIWGRSAWGCQDYRSCRLVIPFVVADCRLALRNVAALVRSGRAQVTRQGKRLGLQLRTLDDPAVVVDGASTRSKGHADPQPVR